MRLEDLEILRCPFCGGRLRQHPTSWFEMADGDLETGLLGCACCAYPVVAGIPFLRTGQTARAVLRLLDNGQPHQALRLLLGVGEAQVEQFEALRRQEQGFSYRACLEFLSPNPEGTYFLYRFSDPTFLISDGLLQAFAQDSAFSRGPILDLCGGSGHLTRTLCDLSQAQTVWLADLEFWKLWLARQFVAPQCQAVCCDASQPLPFAQGSFFLTICSDALSYIWPRRSLAGEMTRLVRPDGIVVATQLHNAHCHNPSEGLALDPAAWRQLFEEVPARLFKESAVLDAVLAGGPIELSSQNTDIQLANEPALIAISTRLEGFFRDYHLPKPEPVLHRPVLNPLYYREERGSNYLLTLRFPSAFYESEFEACRRYLPQQVELPVEELKNLRGGKLQGRWAEMARQRVLLDLPENYL
jgi:SAM-dependent methyltransferase/uncharacterized protein YbaR (Trm112 family)